MGGGPAEEEGEPRLEGKPLGRHTVKALRAACEARGVATKAAGGKALRKAELVAALAAALAAPAPAEAEAPAAARGPRSGRARTATPLFRAFRALGYVAGRAPFAAHRRGRAEFVTVPVGRTWQLYECAHLRLQLAGPPLPRDVRAVAVQGEWTFAAVGPDVVCCRRAHAEATLRGHAGEVAALLLWEGRLVSVGEDGAMCVWEAAAPFRRLQRLELGCTPTCVAHPATYLNKVLVGSAEGGLQLWNVATGKRIYAFQGWGSAVTCVAPSPALDVVGIGLEDGCVHLHNLKFDESVLTLRNAGAGAGAVVAPALQAILGPPTAGARRAIPVTALAFRDGAGAPLLAVGSAAGTVAVWDLERKQLHTVLRPAHDARVLALHWLVAEDGLVLMSAGGDNSLKHWRLDEQGGEAGGEPRLLRFRNGHSAPPTTVRYYGQGRRILSAGLDKSFRLFSTVQDQQNRELTQKHIERRAKRLKVHHEELKLAPVSAMAYSELREREWCNVVTAHEGDRAAYTWRLQHFTLGEYVLVPPEREKGVLLPAPAPVSAVGVSCCGSFGFVGMESGRVDRYNLQSGIHRGGYYRAFPKTKRAAATFAWQFAHGGRVTGLSSDPCNRTLITAGLDGVLRTWDLKARKLAKETALPGPIARVAHHRPTALVACVVEGAAAKDGGILVLDTLAEKVVRRFPGHGGRITDVGFSEDGQWLLSASLDCTVAVWDVPAGRALQVLHLSRPVTSVSLTPQKDMLATTHAHMRGIYLWANQEIYCPGADSLVTPSSRPVRLQLAALNADLPTAEEEAPAPNGSAGWADDEGEGSEAEEDAAEVARWARSGREADAGATPPVPLAPHLATLSNLPRSRWHGLVHLQEIKKRNAPEQPPQKPAAAPFFLPTVPQVRGEPVFDVDGGGAAAGEEAGGAGSRVVGFGFGEESAFLATLRACREAGDVGPALDALRAMSPSAIHGELESIAVLEGMEGAEAGDLERVGLVLDFIQAALEQSSNFELLQAFLTVFLEVHGDALMRYPVFHGTLGRVTEFLKNGWARLDDKLSELSALSGFFLGLKA